MPNAASSTEIRAPGLHAPGAAVGLRHRLRSATAEAHARIDARFGGLDLTSLSDYRCFLEANADALLPLENALIEAGVVRIFPDWEMRSRRRAILNDLAAIHGTFRPFPPLASLDFGGVLGTMYVLEGSRLGARMLLRTIERTRDPRVTAATAYLRHGEGHQLWPSFLAMLEQHATALDSEDGAIEGALRAFDLFDRAAAQRIGSPWILLFAEPPAK